MSMRNKTPSMESGVLKAGSEW